MSPDMVKLVEVILAGGGGYVIKQAWDWWRDRRRAALPEARHIVQLTHTAQQVDLLAKVNQELEDDLARVRAVLRDTETHSRSSESAWQAREAAWLLERRELQSELDEMHAKVRGLMDEIESLQRKWAVGDR